jgi:hypothetical protein
MHHWPEMVSDYLELWAFETFDDLTGFKTPILFEISTP